MAAQDEEVIVTADRRERPVVEEGSSIAVLGGAELERIGAQHPAEALNRLPGVNYQRGSGVESLPAVRSPVLVGGAGAGSFLILEDGTPVRAAPFANINQAYETNLEFAGRVEVIRGPGTVVHGANAVHGVMNTITPAAGERGRRFELEAGSFGRVRASYLSHGGGWLGGVSAIHEDGWRDNAGLSLQKALLGWDGEAAGWNVRLRGSVSNLEQETAGYVIGPRAYEDRALARGNLNPEAFRDSQVMRATLTMSGALGPLDVAVTPFVRHIEADLLLHFFPSRALERTIQSGGGFQTSFAFESGDWRLLAGADFDRSTMRLSETQSIPTIGTFPQGVHYEYEVEALTRAAYGQARWRMSQDWSLTIGGRAEYTDYDYNNRAPDGAIGRFLRPADREDAFSVLVGRANLVRRFDSGGVSFVNYTTGARPPQATDLYSLQINQTPGEQGVEEIASIEAGLRLPLRGGAVGIALYSMLKRDGSFRNANGFTVSDTSTNHRGVEADFRAPLTADISVSGWIAYADHTYAFDSAADGIVSGARIESSPEWIGSLQLLWRPTTSTELELGWSHIGSYLTEASGVHSYPGHDVFSLRGVWRVSADAEAFVSVRNLSDTHYAERADYAFGNDRYFPGEGRALSLGVRISR